jgi:hypothetical protein
MKDNLKLYIVLTLTFISILATTIVFADHVVTTSAGGTSYSVNEGASFN